MRQYKVASVVINGEAKDVIRTYSNGYECKFKRYSEKESKDLISNISFQKLKGHLNTDNGQYFYSDDFDFLSVEHPEVIEDIIKVIYDKNIKTYSIDGNTIYYDANINENKIIDKIIHEHKKHFEL